MRKSRIKLDKYEQGLEDAIKKGEFVRTKNYEDSKIFEKAAKAYKRSPADEILRLKKSLPNISRSRIIEAINKGRE